ncbi:hypothetical protein [Microtetraspora sp. NBRC 13810]|nr:hypothetical protein [Microtetraspora sp. NBRC 13810]
MRRRIALALLTALTSVGVSVVITQAATPAGAEVAAGEPWHIAGEPWH